MKIFKRVFVLLLMLFTLTNNYTQASDWAVKFADAIIARWPNSINDMTGKSWEYSNSIVLHGIEKAYEETGDVKYLNYIKNFVDDYVDESGNIKYKTTANNLDLLHPSLLCIFLYEQTGLEKYKIAAQNTRNKFNSHPRNASNGYWHKDNYPNQMWLDGIYMAEPFLVKYGNLFNDTAYCSAEATFQVLLLADHAYDQTKKLLYHGWDETKTASWANSTTGVSPEIWSRAMGWYAMAMVDILKYLPKTDANYSKMITLMQNIAEGLKNTQDATTGLWYQVVDKGTSTGNWIETSGSGMFIYSLKHAIDQGYIDDSYMDVVNKAWVGLQNYITIDSYSRPVISSYVGSMGILDSYSSYVGKSKETCPASKHPHGYCGFLMAATAMENTPRKIFQTHINVVGNGSYEFLSGGFLCDSGRVVKIKAIANGNDPFTSWTGDVNGTNETLSYTITDDTYIDLNFGVVDGIINNRTPDLVFFQNPVKESLSIITDKNVELVEIYNINGSLLKQVENMVDQSIDMTDLHSGIYFINAIIDGNFVCSKVLKN
ncbi:MAG: glycoside hydrolase family 88 protein [Marinilabiliaceae bacterium]|nr:glycoside hydrolase family 88 protein [Marinilabiliaceae bacterium]